MKQANRALARERAAHNKHPLPITQEKTLHMDITDGQYQNQICHASVCSSVLRHVTTKIWSDGH